jgi:hypothetical protein
MYRLHEYGTNLGMLSTLLLLLLLLLLQQMMMMVMNINDFVTRQYLECTDKST